MSESGKTLTYIGVALGLGIVMVLAHPRPAPIAVGTIVGKPLFEKFTDPGKAASLEIVKYDEAVGESSKLKIAKHEGMWSIDKGGSYYPADAENQMKEAATSLVNLTVLGVASEAMSDHEMFGVVEPGDKVKAGDKGVGLLVSFEDEAGVDLGSLVIGKEVKNNPDQRFVRVPRQDKVFVVKISPAKLSTKFEDWIEKDLLKINAFDVERLRMKDHSVVRTAEGYLAEPRAEITVSMDPNNQQWKLDEMLVYREGGPQKTDLLPGEELNKEKLDGLKNALSEVKIADVFQKPKGLDASLKSSENFLNDRDAQRSLAERGFLLSRDNEIWSANGELQVGLKDGVEYVLRFGNIAGAQEDSKDEKLNRYLFVMARVDESKFPRPVEEELPPLPGGASPAPATTPAPPEKEPTKPAENTEKAADTAEKEKEKSGDGCGQEPAAGEKKDQDTEKKDTEKKDTDEKKSSPGPEKKESAEKKDSIEKAPGEKDAGQKKDAAAEKAPPAPQTEEELKRKKIEAERDRIAKENKRKLEKWQEDKGKAEEKVRDLNARFAPWYYVISEDVYKKIHLSRSDILREGAKSAEEGTGIDAFRKLEKEGLKKGGPAPGGLPGAGGFPGSGAIPSDHPPIR